MNITVYLGANPGNDPALKWAARELGTWIGQAGHALIYGGSKAGLMGELAESVLLAGGEVTGVEPQFFIDAGFEYNAITRLIVTQDMSERKAKMIALGDAFIASLYNLNGYYDDLRALLNHMIETGLSSPEKQRGICFADDLAAIQALLDRN